MSKASVQAFYNNLTETGGKIRVFGITYPTGVTSYNIDLDIGSYCAQTFAEAIHTKLQAVSANLNFELKEDGRYRMYSSSGNFDLALNPFAKIFGSYTASNISDTGENLNKDPRTLVLSSGIHWEHPGMIHHYGTLVCNSGHVRGYPVLPAVAEKKRWSFTFLTDKSDDFIDPYPSDYVPIGGVPSDVLGAFAAGAKIRVYRNWKSDLTVWSVSNIDGYTDCVITTAGGLSHDWEGPLAQRFNVSIEAVGDA